MYTLGNDFLDIKYEYVWYIIKEYNFGINHCVFLWPRTHLKTITPRMFMSKIRNFGKSRFSVIAALAINALNKMNRYFASISTLAVTIL